jgi:hypothetical protein
MKIIHVFGDVEDYAVVNFNQLNLSLTEKIKRIESSQGQLWEFQQGQYAEILDFPNVEVTEAFIDWIKDTISNPDDLMDEDFILI